MGLGLGRRGLLTRNTAKPKELSQETVVDEEKIPGYDWKTFYHPNPGDILDARYQLKAKLGWGSSSTVWLAQDISAGRHLLKKTRANYFALKINANNYSDGDARHELNISLHLSNSSTTHHGKSMLVTAVDHFTIRTTWGSHLCIVFDLMREPIWLYRQRLRDGMVTPSYLPVFKFHIVSLLQALDYMHSECHVIHTDLKLDNILMSLEDDSVLQKYVQDQLEYPMARKTIGDRAVYLSHNSFGAIRPEFLKRCVPRIALCADMWNFGVMVWDLLAGRELFHGRKNVNDSYSAAHHLAEMIAFIGPIPATIVQQEKERRHWRWSPAIPNDKGKLCDNAADYYGGPFFDKGEFLHDDLIPFSRNFDRELPDCIPEGERALFLAFMRRILRWVPEERATAKELLGDPWLQL